VRIHPIPNHANLPDIPSDTLDDHTNYWADTLTGDRTRSYTTHGIVTSDDFVATENVRTKRLLAGGVR
tara:strand:+ start:94 stop:297 length:204 start_codon:yes stop_codon:yes gene_type:complete